MSPLELTPGQMRALGYRAVDLVVDQLSGLGGLPPARGGSRRELEPLFRESAPETGAPPEAVLDQAIGGALARTMHVNHPRFFAFVPSPGNFVGAVADFVAAGFNPFVGTWLAGSGAAEVELVTIDWLREICGMPETAGGLFVSGGSMANLTALAAARQARLGGDMAGARVYFSSQTHSSVERALRVIGFAPEQLRKLPADAGCRLPLEALAAAVAQDRRAGLRPFCVAANAGTTNTGAVDPFPELADFCRRENLWLHADGAYGAAAMICEQGRAALRGLEEVDSLSLDPHKWLFQPFEIGCVLLRDRALLREAFRVTPDYLADAHRLREEVHFCDYGVQLTRSFRALKLWMSIKVFGLAAFREAVAWGFHLAEHAEAVLRRGPEWEIVSPAQMAIVAFRHRGGEEITKRLAPAMIADGYAMLSTTTLGGRTALRFCTINPRTTEAEIEETVRRLSAAARF
ncbi:MAG: aspartate aminotransferase family protein [Bryobacteraceae bacterium]